MSAMISTEVLRIMLGESAWERVRMNTASCRMPFRPCLNCRLSREISTICIGSCRDFIDRSEEEERFSHLVISMRV